MLGRVAANLEPTCFGRCFLLAGTTILGLRLRAIGTRESRGVPMTNPLMKWPLLRQIFEGGDGTGREAMSDSTRNLRPRHHDAEVARSVCPYCGVGCGQLIFHKEGKLISIEGDPESPISRGHLCPKGADSFELVTHPGRLTNVRYRAPRSREWMDLPLEQALDMVAERLWSSRQRTFDDDTNHTAGIAHLGGATLDIEENYLIKKLFTAGLGMVCLSNQARI